MPAMTKLEARRVIRPARLLALVASAAFMAAFISPALLPAQAKPSAPAVSRLAPNFSRMSLAHRKITLRAYRGKVVLLNFWASWCGPCLVEMPAFARWQKQYGADRFQVIGVSMDDSATPAAATVARLHLDYPVLMGDAYLGLAYGGVLGLPMTFLIDRDGKIRAKYQGAADLPRVQAEIQKLLKSR